MKDINELINFIQNYFPERETDYLTKSEWKTIIRRECPNWEELVKDQKNWALIDNARSRISFDNLCELFVNVAGIELAVRWFNSNVREHREAAREELENSLKTLTSDLWKKLNEDAREYLIYYAFDEYPGEPFSTFRDFARSIKHLYGEWRDSSSRQGSSLILQLPEIRCLPSKEVLCLRSVIKNAGDSKCLEVVEEMLEERKEACEKSLALAPKILHALTKYERELIAIIMQKFRANGYSLSSMPEIYISFETPPLFVAYPEIEEERRRPETIDIEELMGCYVPNPQIILYQRGLNWFSKRYDLNEKVLRGIVLIHEVGHWITHLLPKQNVPFWQTEVYKQTSNEVHEAWAQLITWWVVEERGGEIRDVFEKLNRHQSEIYRIYEDFKHYSTNLVINSLEMLRQLRRPAGMNDWRKFLK